MLKRQCKQNWLNFQSTFCAKEAWAARGWLPVPAVSCSGLSWQQINQKVSEELQVSLWSGRNKTLLENQEQSAFTLNTSILNLLDKASKKKSAAFGKRLKNFGLTIKPLQDQTSFMDKPFRG